MKKLLLISISLVLLFSLFSCSMLDVIEFTGKDGGTYFYEFSDGIKTITNYHPYKFWSLPHYQEMVQYGDGAGLENEGRVYFIYVVDTSIDADSPKAYYTAEFDAKTKELLSEEGEYFEDEETKNSVIEKLLKMVDEVYVP